MSRTKPSKSKARRPRFELTDVERMLLQLYRTVPIATRAQVGTLLFEAWTHPPAEEKDEMQHRYEAAGRAFQTGPLFISVMDDMCAGGFMRVEDIECAR